MSVLGLGLSGPRVQLRPCAVTQACRSMARSTSGTHRLARRMTSFWATSYPSPVQELSAKPGPSVPEPPPLPAPSAVTQTEEPDRQRAKRQQRYLDSLMDKADEVRLQCRYPQEHLSS